MGSSSHLPLPLPSRKPAAGTISHRSRPGLSIFLRAATGLGPLISLLGGLSAGDRVAVVKYAEAAQAILDFTADKQAAGLLFLSN